MRVSFNNSCFRGFLSRTPQSGVTLIEMLVVTAIFGIVASIIVVPFLMVRQQTVLNTETEEIITLINKARLSTMAAKGGVQYGVRFEVDRVILFQGPIYNSIATTNEVRMIDSSMQLSLPVDNGGGTNNILFDFITGATSQNSTTTLLVTSRPQASSTIIINSAGLVTLSSSLLSGTTPVLSIYATPSSVPLGTSSTIIWSSGNTTACATNGGGWGVPGSRPTAGSESTGSLSVPTIFTLNCTGPYGSIQRSVTVGIDLPVVTLTASPPSVILGNSSLITWSVSNATGACTASDGWSGSKSELGGSEGTANLLVPTTYALACTNSGGTIPRSVVVGIVPPTVNISASPATIPLGASSLITWSSDATSCTAAGPVSWAGAKALSGTQNTGNIAATSVYTLSCTGPNGTTEKSTTVTVTTPEFIQIATGYLTSVSAVSSTFEDLSTDGNLIVVGITYFPQSGSISSVTDSSGNIYVRAAGPQNWSGTSGRAEMWYAKNIIGGSTPLTISANLSIVGDMEIYSAEYANLNTINPLDQVSSASGFGAVADSGARTTTYPGELIVSYAENYSKLRPASGFAARSTFNSNIFADGITTSVGSYSATSYLEAAQDWVQFMLTFH